MAPRRRKTDTNGNVIAGIKATAAFIFFGALSFIGTWGVGLSNTVATLKEQMAVLHEKQEFLAPWLVDEVKAMREEVKELRKEIQSMNEQKRRRQ